MPVSSFMVSVPLITLILNEEALDPQEISALSFVILLTTIFVGSEQAGFKQTTNESIA